VLNAPPQIVTERQAVVEEEDLDEDRRVADHLDIERGELADERDARSARGAEHDPDRECAADPDARDLERALEAAGELRDVLADERPVEAG
jgi:hypothetical protein